MEESYINMLIKRFFIERERNDYSGIYAITQVMFAYHSNKMEGNRLTKVQTSSMFEAGSFIANGEEIRAIDVEETTGHFLLFNTMMDTFEKPLTHELIKLYHHKLKCGVWEDQSKGYPVGEYKIYMNTVSNISTALPSESEEKVSSLLSNYHGKPSYSIDDIAKFHAEFEKIHPFQDGNGRVGRMIMFKECLKNNLIPLIILSDNKDQYYKALNKAQSDFDITLLSNLYKSEQISYFNLSKDFVIPYKVKD